MNNTCCFFGHREITESEELREKLALDYAVKKERAIFFLIPNPTA